MRTLSEKKKPPTKEKKPVKPKTAEKKEKKAPTKPPTKASPKTPTKKLAKTDTKTPTKEKKKLPPRPPRVKMSELKILMKCLMD